MLVELRRREYALLEHLAYEPERVWMRHKLLRDVWGYRTAGTTRTVDTHASRVRASSQRQARSDGSCLFGASATSSHHEAACYVVRDLCQTGILPLPWHLGHSFRPFMQPAARHWTCLGGLLKSHTFPVLPQVVQPTCPPWHPP
jgi:hypothetical protein